METVQGNVPVCSGTQTAPSGIRTADTEIERAHIVRSGAGRDKGKLFVVLAAEGEYLLLADGKSRTLERPKRKKRRHVQFVSDRETRLAGKIRNGLKITNSELRRTLAAWRNHAEYAAPDGYVLPSGQESVSAPAPEHTFLSGVQSGNAEQEG